MFETLIFDHFFDHVWGRIVSTFQLTFVDFLVDFCRLFVSSLVDSIAYAIERWGLLCVSGCCRHERNAIFLDFLEFSRIFRGLAGEGSSREGEV